MTDDPDGTTVFPGFDISYDFRAIDRGWPSAEN